MGEQNVPLSIRPVRPNVSLAASHISASCLSHIDGASILGKIMKIGDI